MADDWDTNEIVLQHGGSPAVESRYGNKVEYITRSFGGAPLSALTFGAALKQAPSSVWTA